MYYCLIYVTFLNQFLQIKDEDFLYCWDALQQIMERGNFILGARRGSYCSYYQPDINILSHRLIMQTLKNATEHLAQHRSELSGYKIAFSICDHNEVEQEFLSLRGIIVSRVEGERLWFTEKAASMFTSYAQFIPSGDVYEYQHSMQDNEYSLFTKFISTKHNISTLQRTLRQAQAFSTRTLFLFVADAYSGGSQLIETVLKKPDVPDSFHIQLSCLKELSILESFRTFLRYCDTIPLRKEVSRTENNTEEAFSNMLMDIERITDNKAIIPLEQARQYIIEIFTTMFRLYTSLMQRLDLVPYVFIDSIDFCSSQDLYFLDVVMKTGDPNNDIILIGTTTKTCQLESVKWKVKTHNLKLGDYDFAAFQEQYPHIKSDTIKKIQGESLPPFHAFSKLLGEALHSKNTTSPVLWPLLPIHLQLLYVIRKSIPYHITIEYLLALMSQEGYKSSEIYDTILFLIHHGYLRNINTLYLSRCTEELFFSKAMTNALQSNEDNLDRHIATYFADLHFREEIQLPQRFFYESFLTLSFEYWMQNVYLHCERFTSVGIVYSYLDNAVFMNHIKNVKANKQYIMKPVILILRAQEYIFTRTFEKLKHCITLLQKIDTMPEYLRIPWYVIQSKYHLITGTNPESAAKKILKEADGNMKRYQSLAYCVLGIQSMYKGMREENSKYFSLALSYAEPHHNLHVTLYEYLASCSSNFLFGNFDDVRIHAEQAIQLTKQYAVYIWETAFLIVLARLEFDIGHYKRASEIFEQAGNIADQYEYTTLLQSARCWEARSIGYGGNWSGAHKILRQSPDSLERSYFLAEALYFSQNYEAATEFINNAIKSNEKASHNSTMFCAPYCWTNAWDIVEHLFVEKSLIDKPQKTTALARLLYSFAVLIHTATGELETAASMTEDIINITKHLTVDQNFPFYYQICAMLFIENKHEIKNKEYANLLSQAVRFLKERSSNIENRFERQHFVSHNYWNSLLLSHAKEYNITN